jgi:hypothetical protein
MIANVRADYIPRAALEAYNKNSDLPGKAPEDTLVLRYPSCFIFYVRKADMQLRTDMCRGLVAAFNDGHTRLYF